jgi:hypothetical protein
MRVWFLLDENIYPEANLFIFASCWLFPKQDSRNCQSQGHYRQKGQDQSVISQNIAGETYR